MSFLDSARTLAQLSFVLLFVIPSAIASELKLEEDDAKISVVKGDEIVLTYNKQSPPVPEGMETAFRRSGFIHPVVTPSNKTITAAFPFDHPHQQGLFTAWVSTDYDGREIDFWNLAEVTGRVSHERITSTEKLEVNGTPAVRFEADLLHQIVVEPAVDVLREHWVVTAYATDGKYHQFDIAMEQQALTDKPLTIKKYHYGGVGLRCTTRWLIPNERAEPLRAKHGGPIDTKREPSDFLNDLGSNRTNADAQHAKWVAVHGQIDGEPTWIAVLDHPSNFRFPQNTRVHPSKPYFSYSPCKDGEFTIEKGKPFQSRYRYLVGDGEINPQWLNEQWTLWSEVDASALQAPAAR